jgi:hypothetical protein
MNRSPYLWPERTGKVNMGFILQEYRGLSTSFPGKTPRQREGKKFFPEGLTFYFSFI